MQASPEWDAAARLRGAVRTPYGDLRLFARKKAEKGADLGGMAGMSERLNEQGGLGKPHPPPPSPQTGGSSNSTPESQKTASEYATAKSTQSTSPGSRGYEPNAKGFTQEERRSSSEDLLAKMQRGAPPPPPPPPPPQPTGQRQVPGQHFTMGKNLLNDLAMPGQGKKKQPPPQAAMNKAPPMPAPPLGEFAPHLPAPPLGEFKIPKKERSNSSLKTAGYTPKPPNKQPKGKNKAKPTKTNGETYGERALRLQKEAWEKQKKANPSDTESTSSRSSARTTRSATSKREHSPGGPATVKKKDDKPSPAAAKLSPTATKQSPAAAKQSPMATKQTATKQPTTATKQSPAAAKQ